MAITETTRSRGFQPSTESRRLGAEDESSNYETSANDLSALLRRALGTPMHEIDKLIGEFELLRKRLETDADRIQREITDYAELSRRVRRITAVILENVKKWVRTLEANKSVISTAFTSPHSSCLPPGRHLATVAYAAATRLANSQF
jgi:hypothetical protein